MKPASTAFEALHRRLDERDFLHDIKRICKEHHVTLVELLGKKRYKHVVIARDACALFLHDHGLSTLSIGQLLGRDHSSIVTSLRRARAKRDP